MRNPLLPEELQIKGRTADVGFPRAAGFTMLELLAAMVILTIAMSVAFEAFSGTIRGWKRGTEVVEGIKHGEFAMGQLAAALASTVYFNDGHRSYDFITEIDTIDGLPANSISIVTSSAAFMSGDSLLRQVPHRLNLYIDYDDEGEAALFALVQPAVAMEDVTEQLYGAEPYLVSRDVKGMEVMWYDDNNEIWSEEAYEKSRTIPSRILLSLYVPSDDQDEEPIVFTRVIEIPVAQSMGMRLKGPTL